MSASQPRPESRRLRTRKRAAGVAAAIALLLITALALWLRLWHAGARSFWVDEGASVAIARLDWWNFARLLWRREGNMALYYLLLRGWLQLGAGATEGWVRALSALFGTLTIPAIYFAAKEIWGRGAGVAAALLLAINAYHIRYSQEARGYSLAVLLVTVSTYFLLRLVKTEPTGAAHPRIRWGYVIASALAVYAHFYAGLVLVAQWLWLWRTPRPIEQKAITRKAVRDVLIGVAPAIVFVASTGAGPLAWLARPNGRALEAFATSLAGGGLLLLAVYAGCGLLAFLPPAKSEGRDAAFRHSALRLLLLWLLLPAALTFALSFARPLFLPRFLIVSLPALGLLAAAGISQIRPRGVGALAGLVLVVLAARSVAAFETSGLDQPHEDWRAVTAYVLERSRPGDGIIFYSSQCRMPFDFYARGAANAPQVAFPAHAARLSYLDFMGKPEIGLIKSLPSRFPTLWLVTCHNRTAQGPDAATVEMERMIRRSYPETSARQFPGVEVEEFTGNNP